MYAHTTVKVFPVFVLMWRESVLSPLSSDPRQYRVVAGEYNLDEDEGSEQFIGVEKIIVHPGWTGDLGNG